VEFIRNSFKIICFSEINKENKERNEPEEREHMDERKDGWMVRLKNGRTDDQKDVWMDEGIDGWMG
jgi:hypothetical protein